MKHLASKIQERAGLKGIYTFTLLNEARLLQIPRWERFFNLKRYSFEERWEALRREASGLFVAQWATANLVPTVGRAVLARRLAGNTTYTGDINYTSLGTGTNAPANGDTQLQTETYRKTTASKTYSNNIAYITAFYTAAEVSGTFNEVGLHIDGTASANSGQLFSRVKPSPAITKAVTETLTVDYVITIS